MYRPYLKNYLCVSKCLGWLQDGIEERMALVYDPVTPPRDPPPALFLLTVVTRPPDFHLPVVGKVTILFRRLSV